MNTKITRRVNLYHVRQLRIAFRHTRHLTSLALIAALCGLVGFAAVGTALAQDDSGDTGEPDVSTSAVEASESTEADADSFVQIEDEEPSGAPIRVSSSAAIEQLLIGEIIVQYLQAFGLPVESQTGMVDELAVRAAFETGTIDVYPEYTGSAIVSYSDLPIEGLPTDPLRVYELAKALDEDSGIVWLQRAPIDNSPILLVQNDLAAQGIDTVQTLVDYLNTADTETIVCAAIGYVERPDGIAGLQRSYGLTIDDDTIQTFDQNDLYAAIQNGECDVATGFSLYSYPESWGMTVIEDSQDLFAYYDLAPVVSSSILAEYPELEEQLNVLFASLQPETVTSLLDRVTLGSDSIIDSSDELAVEEAARQFLRTSQLVEGPAIRVASHPASEQILLAKMMIGVLRSAGLTVEDMTGLSDSATMRNALLDREIDIYPEYTNLEISLNLGLPILAIPLEAERSYSLVNNLDRPNGVVWLTPSEIGSNRALLVQRAAIPDDVENLRQLTDYTQSAESPLTACVDSVFADRTFALDLTAHYGFASDNIELVSVDLSEISAQNQPEGEDAEAEVAESGTNDSVDAEADAALDPLYDLLEANGCVFADVSTNVLTENEIASTTDAFLLMPPENLAPVIHREVLDIYPEIGELLEPLLTGITVEDVDELLAGIEFTQSGEVVTSGDVASLDAAANSYLVQQRLVTLPDVAVGNADVDEGHNLVLTSMIMLLLEDAGYNVIDQSTIGGDEIVREAILSGEVDLYIESVASALSTHNDLPVSAIPTEADRAYLLVSTLDEDLDIVWLDPIDYAEAQSLIVQESVTELGIADIEQLATYVSENDAPFNFCMTDEFFAEEFNGLLALEAAYGFTVEPANVVLVDIHEVYEELEEGECEVAVASEDDAEALGFEPLEDTQSFFLAFGTAPVIRRDLLARNPELADLLNNFAATVDEEVIGELDRAVEFGEDGIEENGDEPEPEDVAQQFLVELGLLQPAE